MSSDCYRARFEFTMLQTIANLNKVAVRVSDVNGQETPCCSLPLIGTREDLDPQSTKHICDILYWLIRQNAEVSTSRHSVFGEIRDRHGILEADLVGSEVQRPFAGTLLPGLHAKRRLVKRDRTVNVSYTEDDMIKTYNLHVYSQ